MSGRGGSIARARVVLAASVVLALLGVGVAHAAGTGYTHTWEVEGLAAVQGASSTKAVSTDEMSMRRVAGGYSGTLDYTDRLIIGDVSGRALVQDSDVALDLDGASGGGGGRAAGSFEGTVALTEYRDVPFAAGDGADIALPPAPTSETHYRVVGTWEAKVVGGRAVGSLLYRGVSPIDRKKGAATRPVSWFNRLGDTAVGAPQEFVVEIAGLSGARPDGATGGSAGGGTGVGEFILRGLTGDAGAPPVSVSGEMATSARALRTATPAGATPMPADAVSMDIDVAGAFLDAKNRAAGLLEASALTDRPALEEAWSQARRLFPATGSVATAGADATASAPAGPLDAILAGQSAVPGAAELRGSLLAAGQRTIRPLAGDVARTWFAAAQAVEGGPWEPAVLGETARVAGAVAKAPIAEGTPAAAAVLAAADADDAPRDAVEIVAFERSPEDDTTGERGTTVVGGALAGLPDGVGGSKSVTWSDAGGPRSVAPAAWLAYRRADGTLYWLAGEGGPVAITDGSLGGWAFRQPGAMLVDALRVGRVLAFLPWRGTGVSAGEAPSGAAPFGVSDTTATPPATDASGAVLPPFEE